MLVVTIVVCGAVVAWVLIDRYLDWRAHRTATGSGAWSSQFGNHRAFHSTGFEDTLPPATAEPSRSTAR